MIKVALKHFIYEQCIDVLFAGITLNFSSDVNRMKFTKGEYYSRISISQPGQRIEMFDCEVIGVEYFEVIVRCQHYSERCASGRITEHQDNRVSWAVLFDEIVAAIKK